MDKLRSKIIRLAYANPKLRSDLLPLLKTSAEEKMVGTGDRWRLTWSGGYGDVKLVELPAKGKKKLRSALIPNFEKLAGRYWSPANIVLVGKVNPSDSFDEVKKKFLSAMLSDEVVEKVRGEIGDAKLDDLIRQVKWFEHELKPFEVVPESVSPFEVKGKNFVVKLKWDGFRAYKPDDPMLFEIVSGPVSARSAKSFQTLYLTLKTDPNALSSVDYRTFDGWLKSRKIPYEIFRFPSYRD